MLSSTKELNEKGRAFRAKLVLMNFFAERTILQEIFRVGYANWTLVNASLENSWSLWAFLWSVKQSNSSGAAENYSTLWRICYILVSGKRMWGSYAQHSLKTVSCKSYNTNKGEGENVEKVEDVSIKWQIIFIHTNAFERPPSYVFCLRLKISLSPRIQTFGWCKDGAVVSIGN